MDVHIITEDRLLTTAWSGGKTAQLAIYPPQCDYARRDFLWRVSSATVEAGESDFTALPDYDRFISVLQGEMHLQHGGKREISLAPYEIDFFDGAEPTHSRGKCRDFNLMLRKGKCSGSMQTLRLSPDAEISVRTEKSAQALLYTDCSTVELRADAKRFRLLPGQSALFSPDCGQCVTLSASEPCRVILCTMRACKI